MYLWFIAISFAALLLVFRKKSSSKRVTIVVLGDVGRSPRMQYHALSFAKQGFEVMFVGYGGSMPHADLIGNTQIKFNLMRESPKFLRWFPQLMVYFLKVIWQACTLLVTLMYSKNSSHLLLQNPPAIPTLAVCWLVSVIRGRKLIIDWHNYGYSVLAMTVGQRHPLTRFAKIYEKIFGRLGGANICVTKAMRADLRDNWGIHAETMYDRPPDMFKETALHDQHKLFVKLCEKFQEFAPSAPEEGTPECTVFTNKLPDGSITLRNDRPVLLISSTSWTEDEDFSMLLSALQNYEDCKAERVDMPAVICVITGKGPQKEYYQSIIREKTWKHVKICTPWLEAEDYPKLLGSADLGVCLHTSTSGLDLPMKVVDMFGCALPVCAVHFKCLEELVQHGHNGMVFHSETELAAQLEELLTGFPNHSDKLVQFRRNLKAFQAVRWEQSWTTTVLPLL